MRRLWSLSKARVSVMRGEEQALDLSAMFSGGQQQAWP